jgi:uroporphyrinogen-III synthase
MALPTLLLTRPRNSAEAFAAMLDRSALSVVQLIVAPLMEIVGTGNSIQIGDEGVIFTSSNGVNFAPEGQGRVAYCVGARTTQQAIARGWDAVQAGETAQELTTFLRTGSSVASLVHLGGIHTRGDIAQKLSLAGIPTQHIALYDQNMLSLSADALKALRNLCIVPVFSPRTAERLVQEAKGCLEHAHIVALSEAVAAPFCGEKTAEVHIISAPLAVYMSKEVENLCRTLTLP